MVQRLIVFFWFRQVNYVIHCASAIRFDLPIAEVMSQNFTPTQELLNLALTWKKLECWCYMSTAFVNLNQPQNAVIQEKIYDLTDATNKKAKDAVIDGLALAREWIELGNKDPEAAQKQVSVPLPLSGLPIDQAEVFSLADEIFTTHCCRTCVCVCVCVFVCVCVSVTPIFS
jgi:hypothetical protein